MKARWSADAATTSSVTNERRKKRYINVHDRNKFEHRNRNKSNAFFSCFPSYFLFISFSRILILYPCFGGQRGNHRKCIYQKLNFNVLMVLNATNQFQFNNISFFASIYEKKTPISFQNSFKLRQNLNAKEAPLKLRSECAARWFRCTHSSWKISIGREYVMNSIKWFTYVS